MKITNSIQVNTLLGTSGVNYDSIIDVVTNLILAYTQREGFEQTQRTITVWGNHFNLKALPLVSIDEVKNLDDNRVLNSADYKVKKAYGILDILDETEANYQIKYTGGYNYTESNLANLPADLVMLATQIAAALYQRSNNGIVEFNNAKIMTESVEGQSVTYYRDGSGNDSENILGGVCLSNYQYQVLVKYCLRSFI
jgi:hypothetical protein